MSANPDLFYSCDLCGSELFRVALPHGKTLLATTNLICENCGREYVCWSDGTVTLARDPASEVTP